MPSRRRWSSRPRTPSSGWRAPAGCPPGARAAEYGSPHGGSWLALLAERGLATGGRRRAGRRRARLLRAHAQRRPGGGAGRADGAGGARRRAAAAVPLAGHDRAARPVELAAPRPLRLLLDHRARSHAGGGGLRAPPGLALRPLRRAPCCSPRPVAATPRTRAPLPARTPASATFWPRRRPWACEDPARVRALQDSAVSRADALHRWLVEQKAAGCTVLRLRRRLAAVALLCRAGVDRSLLAAVADASPRQAGSPHARDGHPGGRAGRADRGAPGCGGRCSCRT